MQIRMLNDMQQEEVFDVAQHMQQQNQFYSMPNESNYQSGAEIHLKKLKDKYAVQPERFDISNQELKIELEPAEKS